MENNRILKAAWAHKVLDFKFEAGTSRGVLKQKDAWYIKLWYSDEPEVFGIGEAAPLKALSVDDLPDFEERLVKVLGAVSEIESLESIQPLIKELPSVVFALETAWLDLHGGGSRQITVTPFSQQNAGIPINGLVWMGNSDFMRKQVIEKLAQGYNCIKMKVGAIDFDTELDILKDIRKEFRESEVTLRVDANGAFGEDDAIEKLERLKPLKLHSIEQPVEAGKVALMRELCEKKIIPIALDEELIGITDVFEKDDMLEVLRPQYIILKPTLLGGILSTLDWIQLANTKKIGWWITSALESNIGLNAISQFTASVDNGYVHGLGTGGLYENNIPSPLEIRKGSIYYNHKNDWDLSSLVWKEVSE